MRSNGKFIVGVFFVDATEEFREAVKAEFFKKAKHSQTRIDQEQDVELIDLMNWINKHYKFSLILNNDQNQSLIFQKNLNGTFSIQLWIISNLFLIYF